MSNNVLSVIIPANNEGQYISKCLDSVFSQEISFGALEVIVAANACSDNTVAISKSYQSAATERGWSLIVLDIEKGGKTNAMNQAEQKVTGNNRVYLDSDIVCSPKLFQRLFEVLSANKPVYASGKMIIPQPKSWASRAYAKVWTKLPFMTVGVPGAGLFAVNKSGRERWEKFPETFADDIYIRLLFKPSERVAVDEEYLWPLTEGFRPLVRNRRRQNINLRDIHSRYPDLHLNEDEYPSSLKSTFSLVLATGPSFLVYCVIFTLTNIFQKKTDTFRSRL